MGSTLDRIRARVEPVLDTSSYGNGDILFVPTLVTGATPFVSGRGIVRSIIIRDKDDQKDAPMYLYFFRKQVTLGVINEEPTIADDDADYITGIATVATADWLDLGGVSITKLDNQNIHIEAVPGTTSIYVAGVLGSGVGSPEHTVDGMTVTLWIERA
jgi:hypothetical protein